MEVAVTRLGCDADESASRSTVLRPESAALRIHLLDEVDAGVGADLGASSSAALQILTIEEVAVVRRRKPIHLIRRRVHAAGCIDCSAVKRAAGNSAAYSRLDGEQLLKVAAAQRQLGNFRGRNESSGGRAIKLWLDARVGGYLDGLRYGSGLKRKGDRRSEAGVNLQISCLALEALRGDSDGVVRQGKQRHRKLSLRTGAQRASDDVLVKIPDLDGRIGNRKTCAVVSCAVNFAGQLLCERSSGDEQDRYQCTIQRNGRQFR